MFMIRLFALIFCISFVGIQAEQPPIIKNTKREKAIDAAIGNFCCSIVAGIVAGFAKIYAEESLQFAQQLPWYLQTSDPYIRVLDAKIVSFAAGGLAVLFAINGIAFAVAAYDAEPMPQEQDPALTESSSNQEENNVAITQ